MPKTFLTQEGINKVKAELFDIEKFYLPDASTANDADHTKQLSDRATYLTGLLANCIRIETKTPINHEPNVEEVWKEFWAEIVCDAEGNVNVEKVKKELYDFKILMRNAGKVYCHITGHAISKIMTDPAVVIQEAEEYYRKCYEEEEQVEE